MTKEETIKIMAMLGAFYGAGKSDPKAMAEGWFKILEPYDYEVAYTAVLKFAENDTRDYATFPAVGCIVRAIRQEEVRRQAPINEVVRAVSYGREYKMLSANAKALINDERYNEWLKMDAEEFANNADKLSSTLKDKQKKLVSGNA